MKDYIITPTFTDHFKYIDKYLESALDNILDKDNIAFCFTIEEHERLELEQITNKYSNSLNIQIICFEDLLKHYKIDRTPKELLSLYGKYSYQTLKKIYTMLYIQANRFLVLDSESMWLRPVRMAQKFDEFFANPFIAGSSLKNRKSIDLVMLDAIKNVDYLLRFECDKWFLENFVWYYDKKILNELFSETAPPIELVDCIYQKCKYNHIKSGVLEIILYHNYIYKNANRLGYSVVDVDEQLTKFLTEENIEHYKDLFYRDCQGRNGLVELAMNYLTASNVDQMTQFFINSRFDIIRCENSFNEYKLQKKFEKALRPIIFAASQEHLFGINSRPKNALKIKTKQDLRRAKSFARRGIKYFFWQISPSYKVVSEMRDMFNAHIHDHYRMENVFRHEIKLALQGQPTAFIRAVEDIKQENTENVLSEYIYQDYRKKSILLIGDYNTNLGTYFLSNQASLTFIHSNIEELRITKNKYPSCKVFHVPTEEKVKLPELSQKYDLIINLSAINEWNTNFLSQSFSLSDRVIFVTHITNEHINNEVVEKSDLIESFLTEEGDYNFVHSVDNYRTLMQQRGWNVKATIKQNHLSLPNNFSLCYWHCQK